MGKRQTTRGDYHPWLHGRQCAVAIFVCANVLGFASAGYGQTNRVNELIVKLESSNISTHFDGENALIKMGAAAVEPLIAALKDPEVTHRIFVVSALGKFQDIRAVEALIAALKDPDPRVQDTAVFTLASRNISSFAVEPLIAALKDPNPELRRNVVSALNDIRDPRALEPLIAALKDTASDVRLWAALALGGTADPRAIEPLVAALNDPDSIVAGQAAAALANIKKAADSKKPLDTPLIVAIEHGSADRIKALILAGTDINARGRDGVSALHVASLLDADFVKMLLNAGADKDAKDNDGDTVLMYAAGNFKDHIVWMLLNAWADQDAKNHNEYATLIVKARNGQFSVVQNLSCLRTCLSELAPAHAYASASLSRR